MKFVVNICRDEDDPRLNAAAVWLERFEGVKKAGGYDRRYMAPGESESLSLFLQRAVELSSGVFALIAY